MEYKKTLYLKNLVFTKNDFVKLSKILFDKKIKDGGFVSIKIYFEDDSQISDDNIEIFNCDYIFERSANSIKLNYRDSEYKKTIDIDIRDSRYLDSSITIESSNQEWFLSVYKLFEEKINNIKKQNFIGKVFSNSFATSFISMTLTIFIVLMFKYFKIVDYTKISTLYIFITIFLIMMVTTMTLVKIGELFPNIEFELDDNKPSKRKKIKKTLKWIISLTVAQILIPIILNIFFM
ncbi:MAG: hypothetical protein PHY08_12210 [Candidatus Cloacimonetes bacterium]|nr:hypothetical protein [Candidatus Cloacimonadota bacterium]